MKASINITKTKTEVVTKEVQVSFNETKELEFPIFLKTEGQDDPENEGCDHWVTCYAVEDRGDGAILVETLVYTEGDGRSYIRHYWNANPNDLEHDLSHREPATMAEFVAAYRKVLGEQITRDLKYMVQNHSDGADVSLVLNAIIDSVDAFRRGFAEAVDAYLDTL